MKGFLLLLCLVLAGCRERNQQPAVEVNNTPTSPSQTTAPVVQPPVVDNFATLRADISNLTNRIASLTSQIEEENKKFEAEIEERLQQTNSSLNNSIGVVRKDLNALRAEMMSTQAAFRTELSDLQSQKTQLESRLGQLEQQQSSYSARMTDLETRMGQVTYISQESMERSNTALEALSEIEGRKVGGFLGIGRKPLLSDESSSEIRRQLSEPSPALPTGNTIQPNVVN